MITNFKNAKDEIENVKSTVSDLFKTFTGNDLVKKSFGGIGKKVSETAQKITKSTKNSKVPKTTESAGTGSKVPNVLNIARQSMGKVGELTPSMSGPLESLAGGFEKIKSFISTAFSAFINLSLPLKIVIGVVALLAVAFATNFGGIRDIVMGVFNKISGAVKSAIDVFKKTGSAAEGLGTLFSN